MRSWIALGLIGFLFAVVSCGANELPPNDDTAGTQGTRGGTTSMAGKSGGGGTSATGATGGTAGNGMITCSSGQKSCFMQATATTPAVTACADLSVDRNNCGACATKCGDSQTCTSGMCACMTGLKSCGMACANPMSDAMNCGDCGIVCPTTTPYCSMGKCSAMCGSGEMACNNNSCANTTNDPLNCGSCGNVCPGGQTCINSVCGCATGSLCNGSCIDTMTTAANCGMCGHACQPGESCVAGVCGGTGVGGAGGMGGSAGAGAMSGSGGTVTAGASGSAGTGTTGGPERANCPITPGLIADFEEGATSNMPVILKQEDRTGEWEMFNDAKSTSETSVVESSGGTADCDKYALHVKGSGYNDWGAGFGFSLVGTPKMPTVYNATTHGFTGIKFKMKMGTTGDSKAPVRFNVSTPWTESAENPGGACTPQAASTNKAAVDCYQHAGRFLYPGTGAGQLTQSFQTYTYCFDRDLYPLSLPSNLTPDQRNAIGTNVLKIQFQFGQGHDYSGGYTESDYPEFAKGLPFDVWIDDVSFVSGECPNMVTSPSNGSPAKPFPQNASATKYGSCDIATNAKAMNGALVEAYKTWTANFVRNNTVIAPEQSNVVTSESMGYGMMIAAAMGDKATFDKFWGYVQGKLSGGLMTWKDGQSGSASDGDIDIAYALLLANTQWPSGGYKTAADAMAGNIASKDIVSNVVRGGSSFQNSNFNASYFIPVAMRKFSSLSGAIATNYGFVNTNISAGAARVPTDWGNPSNGQPSGPGSAQVTSQITDGDNGAMGYDAARVPWRLGQDVCLGGTEGSSSVSSMVTYFAAKYDSGARIDLMKAGWYKKSDGPHPEAKDVQGSYIGPMGVAGMAAGNKAMRDSAFRATLDIMESGDFNHTYFPSTIGFITALIMSGNFPTP